MDTGRNGVTVTRLADAVRAGDVVRVRAMLKARPELIHMDMAENDERRALHYAVLDRSPQIVRVLMAHGADARKGIYPHRDATSALTIAIERGYGEIVAIIQDDEQRRRETRSDAAAVTPTQDALTEAIWNGDDAGAMAILESDRTLVQARDQRLRPERPRLAVRPDDPARRGGVGRSRVARRGRGVRDDAAGCGSESRCAR